MKVTKKHKMYYRNGKGVLLRLDKRSFPIFEHILDMFLNHGKEKEYQETNKGVSSWKDFEPVPIHVPESLRPEMMKITKSKELVVSYDGSWRPLAKLYYL